MLTPAFPSVVPVGDRANETARLFADVAEHLRQARADTIVMFDSDHLNTFFLAQLADLRHRRGAAHGRAERRHEALLAGAVGDLYRMGASAFLLSYLPR